MIFTSFNLSPLREKNESKLLSNWSKILLCPWHLVHIDLTLEVVLKDLTYLNINWFTSYLLVWEMMAHLPDQIDNFRMHYSFFSWIFVPACRLCGGAQVSLAAARGFFFLDRGLISYPVACVILVPWPGIKPASPALQAEKSWHSSFMPLVSPFHFKLKGLILNVS